MPNILSPKEKFRASLLKAQQSLTPELQYGEKLLKEIADNTDGELANRLITTLSRPGKRVRSTMIYLIAKSGSNSITAERMALVGTSIELLHLASLVHDDIIDDSELRRGESTAHAAWGNKMAVLLGDYLLSKSMELVVNEQDRRIPMMLSIASSRLVEGEMKELDYANKDDITVEQYLDVIDGKTASLLEACAISGGILAGFNQEQIDSCGKIGRDFGLAFQIVDDLLDFGIGDSDQLGKSTYADLGNGLVTLPLLYYYNECSAKDKAIMLDLVAKSDIVENQAQIFAILSTNGVFIKTQKKAMNLLNEALNLISTLPKSESMNLFKEICETMAFRLE